MKEMRVMGVCASCTAMFSFDPSLVPTIKVKDIRQPLCQSCVEEINDRRKLVHTLPIPIPAGAYGT
jgi:hypothetical protein